MRFGSRDSHTRALVLAACAALLAGGCSRESNEEPNPVVTVDVAPVLSSSIEQKVTADALIFPRQQSAIVPKITDQVSGCATADKYHAAYYCSYVRATLLADPAFGKTSADRVVKLDTAHWPQFSAPERLTEALVTAARS